MTRFTHASTEHGQAAACPWHPQVHLWPRTRTLPRLRTSVRRRALLALWMVSLATPCVGAELFDRYELAGTIELPVGADVFDVLADGRIIVLAAATVWVEEALFSRQFVSLGTLPNADIAVFGAAFVRGSPDGLKIAVGNNGGATFSDFEIGVFEIGSLTGTWFAGNVADFDAAWINASQLAVATGDGATPSKITVLDTNSADAANPTNPVLIDGIDGASAGVALDAFGNLFTGNGFSVSETGVIRAFPEALWMAALIGGSMLDFDTDGVLIVDLLSASPLGFDAEGNLLAGGGEGVVDGDAAGVVRAMAVADALGGFGAVGPFDAALVRRLDPDPGSNFYSIAANRVSGELYVRDFGSVTLYVYGSGTGVPTVSQWGMTVMALVILSVASILFVRPRRIALPGS